MGQLRICLLTLFVVLLTSCGSNPVVDNDNSADSETERISNFRYDLSCSLKVFSIGAMTVDALVFNKKMGVFNKIKSQSENLNSKNSKHFVNDIEKLETMKRGSASSFLNDSYIACMNESQKQYNKITSAHMHQITNLEECMRDYERHVFIQLALAAEAKENKITSAYVSYIRDRGEFLTEALLHKIQDDIAAMGEMDNVKDWYGYAVNKYFSCKSRHQTLYHNISSEKLLLELQKLLDKNTK